MKKVLFSVAVLAAAFITGCDKISELAKLNKDVSFSHIVDVNGLPNGADTVYPGAYVRGDFPTFSFATDSKTFLESNGSGASTDMVEEVKLKSFVFNVNAPQDANLDYLDSVYIFMSATGLSEVVVASKAVIPQGAKTVELDCNDINMKEYFLKDSIFVRAGGRFSGVPPEGSKLEMKPTYNVKANLLGGK